MAKAAKRSTLTKSVFVLFVFYTTVGMSIFGFGKFEGLKDYYQRIPEHMRDMSVTLPDKINVFNQWPTLVKLLSAWTIPMIQFWSYALLLGIAAAMIMYWSGLNRRTARKAASGSYHGISISIGSLSIPKPPPMGEHSFDMSEFKVTFTPKETALMDAISRIVTANPNAYVGVGHSNTGLMQHTMSVISAAALHPQCDSTLLIIAACHDIGKLVCFTQVGVEDGKPVYVATKPQQHAQESAKMITKLPEFWALPLEQRETIRLAVKYDHSPNEVPLVEQQLRNQILNYIRYLKEADGQVTAVEKKATLTAAAQEQEKPIEDVVTDAFLTNLPSMPFHVQGTGKGKKGVGLKYGNRILLSDPEMRNWLSSNSIFPPDLQAAMSLNFRQKGEINEATGYLLQGLQKRGYLVTRVWCQAYDYDLVEMQHEFALWDCLAGTKEWNGMIIVDLPAQYANRLPAADTIFPLTYVKPAKDKWARRVKGGPARQPQPGEAPPKPDAQQKTAPAAPAAPEAATSQAAKETTEAPPAAADPVQDGGVSGKVVPLRGRQPPGHVENQLPMPGLQPSNPEPAAEQQPTAPATPVPASQPAPTTGFIRKEPVLTPPAAPVPPSRQEPTVAAPKEIAPAAQDPAPPADAEQPADTNGNAKPKSKKKGGGGGGRNSGRDLGESYASLGFASKKPAPAAQQPAATTPAKASGSAPPQAPAATPAGPKASGDTFEPPSFTSPAAAPQRSAPAPALSGATAIEERESED